MRKINAINLPGSEVQFPDQLLCDVRPGLPLVPIPHPQRVRAEEHAPTRKPWGSREVQAGVQREAIGWHWLFSVPVGNDAVISSFRGCPIR